MRDSPLHILVVEDDVALSKKVARVLKRHGCRVHEAASLRAASDAIQRESFDLSILDLVLPDGNAKELIPQLRKQHTNPAVIVFTGHLDAEVAVELAPDADLILPKPADIKTLIGAIDSVSGNERLRYVTHAFAEHANLSSREEQAVWAAVRALTNADAATEMGVSDGTLRTYWNRVLTKTRQSSQRDVIAAVLRFTFRAE